MNSGVGLLIYRNSGIIAVALSILKTTFLKGGGIVTGNDLKGLMAENSLTELKLALALHVSSRTVARWRAYREKTIPERIASLIQGSLRCNSETFRGSETAAKGVVPTIQQWLQSYQAFRSALREVYSSSRGKMKNASQFCRSKGLSRAQFSRVMRGRERPSPRIMRVLEAVCPDAYAQYAPGWVRELVSPNEDYQHPVTVDDLNYLIEVSRGLEESLTVGLAISLLRLRKKPSSQ